MRVDIQHWCVVRTQPRNEERAEINLARQGYSAFLPRIRKQVRSGRRTSWKSVPLFPGYLFVSLDPARTAWSPIQSTYGVAGLVRFGERPATLPPGLVERLQSLSQKDGALSGAAPGLRPGDIVRLEGGVFDDWIGEVIACPDAERVCLLLKAAHRSIEVTVPRQSALIVKEAAGGLIRPSPGAAAAL